MGNSTGAPPFHDVGGSDLKGVPSRQEDYLRRYSAGTLLRASVQLYTTHFKPILLSYVLPTLPFLALQNAVDVAKTDEGVRVLVALCAAVVSFFATGAITITISDICLGNVPGAKRSYGRIFRERLWLSLLGTNILSAVVILAGMVLFIAPGLAAIVMLVFVSQVVVLERVAGMKALKRSAHLVKGSFWRTAGTLLLLFVVLLGATFATSLVVGIGIALLSVLGEGMEYVGAIVLGAIVQGVLYPFVFSATVLMYYDHRARVEAYDVAQLAEDMMR